MLENDLRVLRDTRDLVHADMVEVQKTCPVLYGETCRIYASTIVELTRCIADVAEMECALTDSRKKGTGSPARYFGG